MSDDNTNARRPEEPPEPQDNPSPAGNQIPPPEDRSFPLQMVLGVISSGLLASGTIGLIVVIVLMQQRLPNGVGFLVLTLIPLCLGVLLFVQRRKYGPGLVPGLLTGVGLMVLAAGLCFAMAR